MGNEQSSSGGSCLDRRISIDDDPILTSEGGSWSLYHGKDKESGASVSVYYVVNMKPDDLNVVQLNAQVQIQIVFAFCRYQATRQDT